MKETMKKLTQGATRLLVLALGLGLASTVWAADYTYSNVDRDSLATTSDASYRITSLTFTLNNPSGNYATGSFPASGYVQLTSISIAARSSGYMSATSATLTNNKTSESYPATVTHVSNNFTADLPDTVTDSSWRSWTRTEVHVAFSTDGVLVDTTAIYTLTFNCETGCSVVDRNGSGWKPAMRIYGRDPSGSMLLDRATYFPNISFAGEIPSLVALKDATGFSVSGNDITIPDTPIMVPLNRNLVTMIAKVDTIPSTASALVGITLGNKDVELVATRTTNGFQNGYVNTNTESPSLNNNNGSGWGAASTDTVASGDHWLAAAYNSDGSHSMMSYLDGAKVACQNDENGLRWSGGTVSWLTIGGSKKSFSSYSDATGMNIKSVNIYTTKLTAAQVATVTAALNKGWTVDASGTTLTSATLRELPNDANVQAIGSLTVATTDGTYSAAGLSAVKVLAGGSFNIGTARPTIAGVEAGGTLAVTMDVTFSDRIAGYTPTAAFTVSGELNGTVTLNGETVTPSIDSGTATLTGATVAGNPTYTGNGWWWDYEFNGNGNNIGSEGTNLSWDNDRAYKGNEYTTADVSGNQMLHLPARPWRNVSAYPSEFTAVMFCKAGATANGVLVAFGSTTYGSYKTITLSTGANPSAGDMRLVYGSGTSSSTDLVAGGFKLDNITSANHLYAFTVKTVDNVSQITVYADGDLLTTYTADSLITLGTGFQIASGHGGLPSGVSRLANDDAATMDFLRVSNVALSEAAIKAMAAEYRYVSPNGIAERTLSANATWTDSTNNSWSQKTLNEDGSSTTTDQDTPNSGTVVEITATTDVQLTMDLPSGVSYEKVTFQGDGAITVKAGGTAPTVTTRTTINTDVTMDIAAFAALGAITVADGKTLTIVPDESDTLNAGIGLGIRGETSTIVTGTVTLGEGSQVVLPPSMVSSFASYGFTLTLTRDGYGRYVYTIARADNPVHITKAANGAVTYAMHLEALAGTPAEMMPLPAEPATIPADFASSVTIVNNYASDSLTVATAFAGGAVPVTVSAGSSPVVLSGNSTFGGTVTLNGATTISGTSTFSGAVSGSGTLTVSGTVTVASTGSIANTVVGDGRVVFVGALPSSDLKTSFQDSANWTGTVELKDYTHPSNSDYGIIKFNDYGTSSSAIALNGVTSTIFTGNDAYPNVTLRELEIGEGGWTDGSTGNFTTSPTYTAKLTGHGTITITTGSSGTVKFIGDHTFNGSVAFNSGTGKQVAFMKTSSDTIPAVTAKSIVVAGGLDMSIASGKTWTAGGGIKLDGSLTVLTAEKTTATSGTISAYRDGASIGSTDDETTGKTTYASFTPIVISDNQASQGDVPVIGDQSISGSGGAYMSSLTIKNGATLTYDPVITPLRVESAPVFNGTGKLKLAARYAGVTCGKFHLVSYPSSASVSGTLEYLVDSNSFNNASYTVTEEPVGDYKQLVLKIGDYDTNAKAISIAQFGDSITEGIWRSGYRGTPNYRIPLMQLLEAYGYRPEARGYRSVGSTDANGVPADDNYKWHTGISAQRIHTGLTGSYLRAGFMESIEAHLEQVGVTDIITLKIGTNDSIGNETADNMFEGWSNLVWKIVRMRPTSKIVVCAPVKIRSGENNAPGLRTKIAEYMALTQAEGGFPDGQVTMINGINIVTDDANYYLTDNVHPNWNGHLQLANSWLPAVTNAFESMTARATTGYTAQTVASAADATELATYRAGYVKLATFTNFDTKLSTWGESPYYYVNDEYKDMPMGRVAYFVARKTTTSPDTRYVWVDMDADETTGITLADFGVPTNASVNGVVNNLHIYSNSSAIENVAPTVGGVRGTLMRTEKGVNKADGIPTTLAPTGPYGYDWNDTIGSGSWGAMNMARIFDGATPTDHRKLLAAQMLFEFNGFNGSRQNALGLGDFAVHGPYNTPNGSVDHFNLNWTFSTDKDEMPTMDVRALETGVIEVWGKPVYIATVDSDSYFSDLIFSPELPVDYSNAELLIFVPVSTDVTLTIGSATTVASIRFVVPSSSSLIIADAENLTAGKVFVGRAEESLALVGSVADANLTLAAHNESIADDGEFNMTLDGVTFDGIDATMTLVKPDGTTTELAGTIEDGAVSFSWAPTVNGKGCWIAYEMDYESGNDSKTGWENSGTDTTVLNKDSNGGVNIDGDNAFYNGMLYTCAHPYRGSGSLTYPADGNWSAVVRCTVPKAEDAAVIVFGGYNSGLIGLVAGADPEKEMRLVQTTNASGSYDSHYITNATMTVVNAATLQHVYVFSVASNQTVSVYCDGESITNVTFATPFTVGGGFQIGSVLGGSHNTGIKMFSADRDPASLLSESDRKDARVDCVRLYKGVLGPNAIRQLSVEMPAVKLYSATVAANATTTWNALSWSTEWDGGNELSKIVLTTEGDATLTLPSTITAEDFKIDVASGHVLTLYKAAGGTTITTTRPMEIDNGTTYLADETSLGEWEVAGTGTVRLPDGVEVSGALSGTAKIEVASGDTVSVTSTGSIANTITGSGTITYAALPASALSLGAWTGTVVLPSFEADGVNFNNYGKAGSTIALTGITSGWVNPDYTSVAATLRLDGAVNITAMSTRTYTFAEIDGTGNLSFATSGDQPTAIAITKVAEGYSGTISNTTGKDVVIATLDRQAGTTVTPGTKLLTKSGNVTASALTVGGVAQSVTLCAESDGIYVAAASVQKGANPVTYHTTVAGAMTEAGSDAATITLLGNTDSNVSLALGQSLVTGGFSVGTVSTGVTYYHVVNNDGVYTVVLDTYTITIPSVANTTVSVIYTSGSAAQEATAEGDITVDAGTSLTATWTAASGYKITAGASQTINPVAAAETLAPPTVEAKGATVSGVTFTYGDDFATATVRATVSGDATTYTLTVGTTDYPGVVDGSTVTFSGVATGHAAAYDNVDYTIAATDGTSPVTVSGGSGAAPVADVTADWINERAASATGTSASAEGAGGTWTNAVTYTDGKATITDNRFEATTASTASRVVLEFNVCFSSTSEDDVSGEAQAAIKLGEENDATTFKVLAPANTWTPVSCAGLTPDASATYKVVLTIDYGNNTYGVTVGNYVMTNSIGFASFPLAASRTSVQNIDFAGSGTLTSLKGDQLEGYMVKDGQNHYYATIEAATQAYNSANAPYTVLHNGTAPSGWKIDEATKNLIKVAKGLFFMAY